ncbi:MAG: fluoride efflux transporter CrcB [Acidimicrobiales bacterium]
MTGAWPGLAAAGAVGALCRYLVDAAIGERSKGGFPWGTFVVNMTGSFLLGLITGAALYHGFPATPRIILGAGFCGAYTTFSTWTFETVRLLEEHAPAAAFANAVGSLAAGLGAAGVGLAIASR